ncbi:vacuolar fusion protein MON1 homolog B [Xenopus laevis]|uniref:Vacuolar fusion protein MON1 homolog n=2 Tax=Xenopus laevis TaxID=8355 RepID=A0A1L8EZK1_XENLA|nr:vacuolar fusion protein MON1 homolog B [Xenopus laevis]OCT64761.1 hypothetical protein XELAEV_18041000mg [Xenopus laevis]
MQEGPTGATHPTDTLLGHLSDISPQQTSMATLSTDLQPISVGIPAGGDLEPSTLEPAVREELEQSTLGPASSKEYEPSTMEPSVHAELEPTTLGPTISAALEPSTLEPTVITDLLPSTLGPSLSVELEPSTLGPASSNMVLEPSTLGPAGCNMVLEPSTLGPASSSMVLEPSTLEPASSNMVLEPSTLEPASSNMVLEPSTLGPASSYMVLEPSTLGPASSSMVLEPSTLEPASSNMVLEPSTLGPAFSEELETSTFGPVVGTELETSIFGQTVTESYKQPMAEGNGEDIEQCIVGESTMEDCENRSAADGTELDSEQGRVPLEEFEESSSRELTDSASTENTLEDSGDFPSLPPVVGGGASDVSPPTSPIHRDEDITAEGWRTRRKHVFVLSEAGKPIYSRYGNEEALSSTMGVMMALVSFVQSGDNCIRSIYSDNQKVVFLQEGPLVLVSVSRTPQSEEQLRRELQYVYYQIISMLTQASVARIFERKKNYDLRRLLAGSEKILDSLLDMMEMDPGVLLGAVRCVAIPTTLRDSLSSILTKAITPNLVFSILVAQQQLVTVVQEKAVIEDCRLDPADLHLLLNLIGASSAFQAGEIWTPICLPRFNPDGYFYAYISYLDPQCTVCLVLLSTDKESFYAVSGCKRKIQSAMESQGSLQALAGAMRYCSYSASLVGIPELLHFVYKPLDVPETYRQLPQFTSPEADSPYSNEQERQRLFDLYRYLHCRMHNSSRPLRLIYHVAEKETLLAWVTSKFELYTAFSSLVTKVGAINVITKLLRWIKKEEDRLFIRYPPKYSTTPVPGKGPKASRTDRNDPSQNGFYTGL